MSHLIELSFIEFKKTKDYQILLKGKRSYEVS